MADIGIFRNNKYIELIEGELIEMAAMHALHISTVMQLGHLLISKLDALANISIQCPLRLDKYNESEPDLAVLKRRDNFYSDATSAAQDALLVVEVADSSLIYDRQTKLPLYAKHGVPEYWIVNLQDKAIEAYRQPFEKGYRQTTLYQHGDLISAAAFGDMVVAVSDILSKK